MGTLAMATFDLMTCAYGVGLHEIIRFVFIKLDFVRQPLWKVENWERDDGVGGA